MKFIELKSNLQKEIKPVYCLYGDDRYVLHNALELIIKKLDFNFPDINISVFENQPISASSIIDNVTTVPFGDQYKLVVVKDFKIADGEVDKLKTFFKTTKNDFSVVVFMCFNEKTLIKKLSNFTEEVVCDRLESSMLKAWVAKKIQNFNISFEESALKLLFEYSGNNLSKISVEVDKFLSLGKSVITSADVEEMVIPEKDYAVYELSNAISSGNKVLAFTILNKIFETDKNYVGLIGSLYTSFRRLMYISISDASDEVLADMFKIKPYAVKMSREQAKKYTAKQLRIINEKLSEIDAGVKNGKIAPKIAIDYVVCDILNTMSEKL